MLNELTHKVLGGGRLTREEALTLVEEPLEALCEAADRIRYAYLKNRVDLCVITNAKSGRCPENCRYCAQSVHYQADAAVYPFKDAETIFQEAAENARQGVGRFSMVTAGRTLTDAEIDVACEIVRRILNETGCAVCVSFGLLTQAQFKKLKDAGVTRVHNNLETSRTYFPKICTTHSFEDKLAAISAARRAGLEVCSGGIMGLGETFEDRVDMAFTLRELGVKSVPVNLLSPIAGTPLEHNPILPETELRRTIAIYRFILPDAFIRLAGGRGLLKDKGKACFQSGANAVITGDMLTTAGYTVASDRVMLQALGYEV